MLMVVQRACRYRLQDVELKALAEQKKRAMEKAKAKEKALLEGTYKAEEDAEGEDDLMLEEEEEELTSHMHKEKGGFLSRMTGVNSEKARRMSLLRQLNTGKNPDELGLAPNRHCPSIYPAVPCSFRNPYSYVNRLTFILIHSDLDQACTNSVDMELNRRRRRKGLPGDMGGANAESAQT